MPKIQATRGAQKPWLGQVAKITISLCSYTILSKALTSLLHVQKHSHVPIWDMGCHRQASARLEYASPPVDTSPFSLAINSALKSWSAFATANSHKMLMSLLHVQRHFCKPLRIWNATDMFQQDWHIHHQQILHHFQRCHLPEWGYLPIP